MLAHGASLTAIEDKEQQEDIGLLSEATHGAPFTDKSTAAAARTFDLDEERESSLGGLSGQVSLREQSETLTQARHAGQGGEGAALPPEAAMLDAPAEVQQLWETAADAEQNSSSGSYQPPPL